MKISCHDQTVGLLVKTARCFFSWCGKTHGVIRHSYYSKKKQTLRLGVHVKSTGMVRQSVFSWKLLSFSEARELTENPFLAVCCKKLAVTQVVKYCHCDFLVMMDAVKCLFDTNHELSVSLWSNKQRNTKHILQDLQSIIYCLQRLRTQVLLLWSIFVQRDGPFRWWQYS